MLVMSCSNRTPLSSVFNLSPFSTTRTGFLGETRAKRSAMSRSSTVQTSTSVSIDGETIPRSIWLSMLVEMPAVRAMSDWFFPVFSRKSLMIRPIREAMEFTDAVFITVIINPAAMKCKWIAGKSEQCPRRAAEIRALRSSLYCSSESRKGCTYYF